jgi:hypothetical protein
VSGWDDEHWIDTATFRARWFMASAICNPARLDERAMRGKVPSDPGELVRRAASFWDNAPLSAATRSALERYAAGAMAAATERWQRASYPVLTENALRMLVAVSPDYLTS